MTMIIDTDSYKLQHDQEQHLISLSGSLRLNGLQEYMPVLEALNQAISANDTLTLDMSQLQFLNSSGIAMLSKFIIEARSKESMSLTIICSSQIPWQSKSLKNLQRLYPQLILEIN